MRIFNSPGVSSGRAGYLKKSLTLLACPREFQKFLSLLWIRQESRWPRAMRYSTASTVFMVAPWGGASPQFWLTLGARGVGGDARRSVEKRFRALTPRATYSSGEKF